MITTGILLGTAATWSNLSSLGIPRPRGVRCRYGSGIETSDTYIPAAGHRSLTRFYDLGTRVTMREARWRPLIVDSVAQADPEAIVDLGCGTGSLTIPLAQRTGARMVGVDGDPEVLAIAAAKPGGECVEWTEALVDRLPLGDAEADFVVSSLVFHHLPSATKRAALAEAMRVLKPGGGLIIADWAAPKDPLMSAAFFLLQCLDGFATTGDNRRGMIPALIAEAGFTPPRRLRQIRTVFGSFEVLAAERP